VTGRKGESRKRRSGRGGLILQKEREERRAKNNIKKEGGCRGLFGSKGGC